MVKGALAVRAAGMSVVLLAAGACSGGGDETRAGATTQASAPGTGMLQPTQTPTQPTIVTPTPTATATTAPVPSIEDQFAAWAKKRGWRVGIALTAPGSDAPVIVAGPLKSGTAWSTSKVPVSLAALATDDSASTRNLVRAAIRYSDNASAAALFYRPHGSRTAGAKAVNRTFRRYGDMTTKVASSPGLTTWALKDQAVFAANMACEPDAAFVRSHMGQITPEHSWGLGTIEDARFKGGWGPDSRGLYTVRQMGLLGSKSTGWTAVTIISRPRNGVFETGIKELNAIASWLEKRREQLPVARCE